jgi:Uri superfamily endonuclease
LYNLFGEWEAAVGVSATSNSFYSVFGGTRNFGVSDTTQYRSFFIGELNPEGNITIKQVIGKNKNWHIPYLMYRSSESMSTMFYSYSYDSANSEDNFLLIDINTFGDTKTKK